MGRSESRRAARERAFQVLYGLLFVEVPNESAFRRAFRKSPDPELAVDDPKTAELREAEGFAWELALGACERQGWVDAVIMRFSQNWRVERIAKTELSILRLALYEMLHRPDIPVKVAINEAVELAKFFGDENSRSFVNGILDAAAKAIEHGEIGVR